MSCNGRGGVGFQAKAAAGLGKLRRRRNRGRIKSRGWIRVPVKTKWGPDLVLDRLKLLNEPHRYGYGVMAWHAAAAGLDWGMNGANHV
jgi:hypothetical protein